MAEISIVCITFNHEKFIKAAVSSFFSQDFNGRGEILIFDDFSKDETPNEIKRISKHCPISFQLKLNENPKNIGAQKNFMQALNSVKFEYVAFCEGDDYWTDPYKLQKQVDFLEKNPEYSFCCTNITVIDEFGVEQLHAWPDKSTSFSINKRSLGLNLPVPTCSLVFRADSVLRVKGVLREISKCELADYFLKSWLLIQGKGHFFEEKMAVYRQHGGGIYTQMTQRKRLKSLKKARTQFLLFCIKKGRLFSALICIKNMLYYPNF